METDKNQLNRRKALKILGLSSAAGALGLLGGSKAYGENTVENTFDVANSIPTKKKFTIRIAAQSRPEPTEENISFYKQLGLSDVVLWTDETKASAEYYSSRKTLFADHGMNVYGFGNRSVHNQDKIVLNLPGRDEKIEQYKKHLHDLGKAGIPYTTYAHMANAIWSSERETTRGGASARAFNLDGPNYGWWDGITYNAPLTHEKEYTWDEIWANYEYFIKAVVPVAEKNNVKIGMHSDDPPIIVLGGIPRIFSSFEGYKRAIEIADSPNVGLCLCVGSWMEGGNSTGKNSIEMIEYFGKQKKIFKIHFRNINGPLPHFVESFIDDGYTDMYKIMKALKKVDFDGVLIADHEPKMAGGPNAGMAFSIGYIKALRDLAEYGGTIG